MAATILVIASCIYAVGLRADRIHAQRRNNALGNTATQAAAHAWQSPLERLGAGSHGKVGALADLIHAGRTVTEPDGSTLSSGSEPDGLAAFSGHAARGGASGNTALASGSTTVTPVYWHRRFLLMRRIAYQRGRYAHRLHRMLLASPTVTEAINLAGATYGYTDTLWRKARCESGLNPNAKNGSEASGLFQFLPSTWATTPYARFSIFSPAASALAAGWMHAHGRGGEWSCR